ncbi:MAG: hypothetical protein EON59_07265 [Alphaproteobacteria bacterium]|nr:MAG: hypothetical protein EON59_07265 [Alphaproteobacteria bacterium]
MVEHKPWHRLRGGTFLIEKRTNAWAALIGLYVGRDRLAPELASILHDGTTAETIRRLVEFWGFSFKGSPQACRHPGAALSRASQQATAARRQGPMLTR